MAHLTTVKYINKENICIFLDRFALELSKKYSMAEPVNILIVGGSALALKYEFRSTVDIDADIRFNKLVSESINSVASYYNIPKDWINQDFMKSESYSRRLWDNAIFYGNIRGIINAYVVSDVDQLCMKLTAGRAKDNKDIVFLTYNLERMGIGYSSILERFKYLYGDRVLPKKTALRMVYLMYTAPGYMRLMYARYMQN